MTAIAYATDANYLPYVCFGIRSIVDNTPQVPPVYVVTDGVGPAQLAEAEAYLRPLGVEVRFVPVEDCPIGRVDDYMTRATYLRIAIGDALPASVHRVLFLDADTRVTADLTPLLETDLAGKTIGGVHDLLILGQRQLPKIRSDCELSDDQGYFNAGVMLIDLDRWRQTDVGPRAAEFCEKYPERCACYDQCGLNWALAGDWTEVDSRWNQFPVLPEIGVGYGALPKLESRGGVYHYVTALKPWLKNPPLCLLEHNEWYVATARESPWPEAAADASPQSIVQAIGKRWLGHTRASFRLGMAKLAPALLSIRTHERLQQQEHLREVMHGNDVSAKPHKRPRSA